MNASLARPRARVSRRAARVGVAAVAAMALGTGVAVAATIDGTPGDDELTGTASADTIRGFAGADVISGYGGNDTLKGNNGHDTIYGNDGADTIDGGAGSDKVVGGNGHDDVKGGDGADEIYGLDGSDVLRARDDKEDKVYCGAGNDTAYLDRLDLMPTSELNKPQGTCENIKWTNPWVLPIALSDMPEGKAGLDDPHHPTSGQYAAVDLQAPSGSPIRAIRGGYVEAAGYHPLGQTWCGYGVVIRGVGGGQYMYCHMTAGSVAVSQGQGIGSLRVIGKVGSTGESTGPHLHLQIWKRSFSQDGFNSSVCPQPMLVAIADDRAVPRPADLPYNGCQS
ncbi:peptidoglycan DD-metalloendopeptidase family protein [Phycicoccus sp. CSK15P-2]|uniref:peptidoglycan DD-metalloendopeptidase family protein n=1 Tax=Phycicoccus sp. CSK15P-2 TaxID=2807627 RepID=UPI0019528DA2|nr:peptidoglycan DD-metalloendopeptidase family protein [Phycicoccus sp. CSK15P-2]MBM6405352.1 peptidoglycan DD-metalloendopeptidase family protein [Phycicoccus sp. CSK15P-2]